MRWSQEGWGKGKVPSPELQSRLAKTAAAGEPINIDAHIKRYGKTPSKLRARGQRAVSIRAARTQEGGADAGDDDDDNALYGRTRRASWHST